MNKPINEYPHFQGKYKIYSATWGYLIASFDTLRAALVYTASKGMYGEHKHGSTNIYAHL